MSKSFCKVCYDSGKTEAEYTSHFVKSEPGPKGKIVCPTLLSVKCSYCQDNGHMVSYCTKLKQQNKNTEKLERTFVYKSNHNSSDKKPMKMNTNMFNVLEDEDEKPEKVEKVQKEEYPSLCQVINKSFIPQQVSYAFMVSKPPSEKVQDAFVVSTAPMTKKPIQMSCWADDELSEDEDYEPLYKYTRNHNIEVEDSDESFNSDYNDYYNNDHDDDEVYSYSDYLPGDLLNSVTCANWRNFVR